MLRQCVTPPGSPLSLSKIQVGSSPSVHQSCTDFHQEFPSNPYQGQTHLAADTKAGRNCCLYSLAQFAAGYRQGFDACYVSSGGAKWVEKELRFFYSFGVVGCSSARMEQYDQNSLRMPVCADLEYLYTPRLYKLRLIGVVHG